MIRRNGKFTKSQIHLLQRNAWDVTRTSNPKLKAKDERMNAWSSEKEESLIFKSLIKIPSCGSANLERRTLHLDHKCGKEYALVQICYKYEIHA